MNNDDDRIAALEHQIREMTDRHEENHRELLRFIDKGLKILTRNVKYMERNSYNQVVAYLDLRQRIGFDKALPPLRGHAISPDTALFLDDLLKFYRPKSILELGSGLSSAIIALHCVENGGTVTSVDHLAEFGRVARDRVVAWGAGDAFRLIIANVIEQQTSNGPRRFYDFNAVAEADDKYDFVFLDGPPKAIEPKVRGNLLPLFAPILSEGCIILLDDYYRSGERNVVSSWVKAGYVEVLTENQDVEKHAAVLRFKGASAVTQTPR